MQNEEDAFGLLSPRAEDLAEELQEDLFHHCSVWDFFEKIIGAKIVLVIGVDENGLPGVRWEIETPK